MSEKKEEKVLKLSENGFALAMAVIFGVALFGAIVTLAQQPLIVQGKIEGAGRIIVPTSQGSITINEANAEFTIRMPAFMAIMDWGR